RPGGPGEWITECQMAVNEIAHRLNSRPSGWSVGEEAPGDVGQPFGVAVATLQQVDQRILGQLVDSDLLRVADHRVWTSGVVDHGVCTDLDETGRGDQAGTQIAETVAVS